jgi:hypothetical protein
MGIFIETSSIDRSTKVNLDTRTEGLSVSKTEDTRVGDLGLNKGSRIQLELGTNFKSNGIRALGIPSSLTGSFEIAVDTVVVRGSILAQVVCGVNGNTIFKSRVTKSSVIATDLAIQNVVGNFGTSKETVLTKDRVNAEVGLEDIKSSNGVDIGLLVGGVDLGSLFVDRRKKRSQEFELETLSKVIFQFNLSVEVVGGSPSFSESETVLLVSILGLKITNNDTSLVVTLTVHLEGDTVRSSGLDFKLDATNGVVLR